VFVPSLKAWVRPVFKSMVKVVVIPFTVSCKRCPEPVEGRSPSPLQRYVTEAFKNETRLVCAEGRTAIWSRHGWAAAKKRQGVLYFG
jgi:hypothetical protein